MQIYELTKRNRAAGYDYEIVNAAGRVVTHREETRTYKAAALREHPTIPGAYSVLQWTGDVRSLQQFDGDGLVYAIDRNVKTKDVPEFLRPAFVEWQATFDRKTEGDRVRFDRGDGLYYAIVNGREFGGWHTRPLAEGGLAIEQKRAAERAAKAAEATPEPASSADADEPAKRALLEAILTDALLKFAFSKCIAEELDDPNGPVVSVNQITRARRRAVMAIDEAARDFLADLNDRVAAEGEPADGLRSAAIMLDADEAAEYDRTPRENPATGWHHTATGSSVGPDDDYPEPPDAEGYSGNCYKCGREFWRPDPIGDRDECDNCEGEPIGEAMEAELRNSGLC